jgi:ribose transport system ATP-binding protein
MEPQSDSPLLQMRGIVKQFPGVRALDGVDLDVTCRRGALPARARTARASRPSSRSCRRAPARRGHRALGGRGGDPQQPAVGAEARHRDDLPGARTSSPASRSPTTSTSATSSPTAASSAAATRSTPPARSSKRLGHGEIPPQREVGRLSAAGQQIVSLARALAHEVAAHRHGRAVRGARPRRGRQPLPRHPRPHRGRRRRSSTSPTGWRRSARSGTSSPVLKDGRTVATGLPAKETPTQQVVSLMTGRNVEYVFPPRPGVPDGRAGAAAGRRAVPRRRVPPTSR